MGGQEYVNIISSMESASRCSRLFLVTCLLCFCVQVSHAEAAARAPPAGYLLVGSRNYSSSRVHHEFYDREGTNFSCHATAGSYVKLTYTHTRAGESSSTGPRRRAVSLYRKLRASDDGAAVTCVVTEGQGAGPRAYVITLALNRDRRELLSFDVNGLVLPLIVQNNTREYQYMYHAGELLTVGIVHDEAEYGDVQCTARTDNLPIPLLKDDSDPISKPFTKIIKTFSMPKDSFDTYYMSCSVRKKDESSRMTYMSLKLSFHHGDYYPFVSGLAMSHVASQYSGAASTVLSYDAGRRPLRVACVTRPGTCPAGAGECTNFTYDPSSVISTPGAEPGLTTFQLQPHRRSALIRCEMITPPLTEGVTHLHLFGGEDAATATPPAATRVWVVALAVVLATVSTAAAVWVAFVCKRKLSLKNTSLKMCFRDVRGRHRDPLTSPSPADRPDDVTPVEPTLVDHLYAVPTARGERTKIEPACSEPGKPSNLHKQRLHKPSPSSLHGAEPADSPAPRSGHADSPRQPEPTRVSLRSSEYQQPTVSKRGNHNHYSKPTSRNQMLEGDSCNEVTYAELSLPPPGAGRFSAQETPAYSTIVPRSTPAPQRECREH